MCDVDMTIQTYEVYYKVMMGGSVWGRFDILIQVKFSTSIWLEGEEFGRDLFQIMNVIGILATHIKPTSTDNKDLIKDS